jgi:hypothetical protein
LQAPWRQFAYAAHLFAMLQDHVTRLENMTGALLLGIGPW